MKGNLILAFALVAMGFFNRVNGATKSSFFPKYDVFATLQDMHMTDPVFVPKIIEMNKTTGKYFTEGVVPMDSIAGKDMLEGAFEWLSEVKYVNSLASKGIILDEAVFNKIIVNQYFVPPPELGITKIRFKLTLEFRDGRFKFNFTDFTYYQSGGKSDFEEVNYTNHPENAKLLQKMVSQANSYVKISINELIGYLSNYHTDESW